MKKLITIENLQVGMFLEAQASTENKDGTVQRFLVATHALSTGPQNRRVRLTGRMHEKVEQDGGLLITSRSQVETLQATGLSMITIDTDKGKDLPENVKPLTDPSRRPPPEGRLVHFDEELEHAKEVRAETTDVLKNSLADVSAGKELDVGSLEQAGSVIAESVLRNVDAMVSLTRLKKHDPYTAMHCMNVCTLVTAMAMHGGASPAELPMITAAALLHDVGKTRVPLEVLNKPGRFEPHELEEMRKHATHSGDIMKETGGFGEEAIAIATQHHEMMDGSGYPLGLAGDQLHYYARLTAVADVYDALTAKRVYKPAMPMHQALLRIHKNKLTEFDEGAVDLFIKTLGLYPVGSLVELSTKERAIVYEPNPKDSRRPVVGIFTMANQRARSVPLIVDLALRSEADGRTIVSVLDPERVGEDPEEMIERVQQRGERGERRLRS